MRYSQKLATIQKAQPDSELC